MASHDKAPEKNDKNDHAVGYGKPPKHTQFKPGQSGNPKGRPKGTKNLKTDLIEELAEKVPVQEGGQAKSISKQRAVVKTLVNRTLKGDIRAGNTLISTMMRLLDTGEGAEPEESEVLDSDELEILESLKKRLTQPDEPEPAPEAAASTEESS